MVSEDVKENSKSNAQAAAGKEREIDEWAKSLGIAPARLKQAILAVGITPKKIREYLRNNR
jgi:hypothetical protein